MVERSLTRDLAEQIIENDAQFRKYTFNLTQADIAGERQIEQVVDGLCLTTQDQNEIELGYQKFLESALEASVSRIEIANVPYKVIYDEENL